MLQPLQFQSMLLPARASTRGSQISRMMSSASSRDSVLSMVCRLNDAVTFAHACCSWGELPLEDSERMREAITLGMWGMMSFPCILATSSYREIAYDRDPPDSRDSAIYKSHHYHTSEQKLLTVEKIHKPDFITTPMYCKILSNSLKRRHVWQTQEMILSLCLVDINQISTQYTIRAYSRRKAKKK